MISGHIGGGRIRVQKRLQHSDQASLANSPGDVGELRNGLVQKESRGTEIGGEGSGCSKEGSAIASHVHRGQEGMQLSKVGGCEGGGRGRKGRSAEGTQALQTCAGAPEGSRGGTGQTSADGVLLETAVTGSARLGRAGGATCRLWQRQM